MQTDTAKKQYEHALKLVESGSYEQALDAIMKYLETCPDDGKAFNDAGSILFCMQRGKESIEYFEKALILCEGDEQTQVNWNLCEAYIHEGYPEKAAAMFNQMYQQQVLNPDIVNRTAELFLNVNNLGRAIETLSLSLKLWPKQDVLRPMIQMICNQRKQLVVVTAEKSLYAQMLINSLKSQMPTRLLNDCDVVEDTLKDSDFTVFLGISNALTQLSHSSERHKTIVVLQERDFYHPLLKEIDFTAVDVVIPCAPVVAINDLKEYVGSTPIIAAEMVPDAEKLVHYPKKFGKRIAAIGPWSARNNPMYLLQCFQKLHYIDSDYRLYLAGWFEDEGLERYINTMIDAMDLENEIVLDTSVKNISKWLKDKHYIISTAIDSGALGGVWIGAACGLKPVVHRFAGVQESIESSYVFDLAEEFCEQILDSTYEPLRYRQMALLRYEQAGVLKKVHSIVSSFEKQLRDESSQATLVPETVKQVPSSVSNKEYDQQPLIDPKGLADISRTRELTNV